MKKLLSTALMCVIAVSALGCRSPYRSDQGALLGGLLGAGAGAIVGNQLGNTGAGAAIGAGLGVISGAVIGSELDEIEAENRAAIAQQMGREISASAVTIDDVISMTQSSVADELIVTHIRAHGVARPLEPSDLAYLTQQGVSTPVIKAMQEPPRRPAPAAQPVVIRESRPPIIIREYHNDPFCDPHYSPHYYSHGRRYNRGHSRPATSFGMTFHN